MSGVDRPAVQALRATVVHCLDDPARRPVPGRATVLIR